MLKIKELYLLLHLLWMLCSASMLGLQKRRVVLWNLLCTADYGVAIIWGDSGWLCRLDRVTPVRACQWERIMTICL